MSPEMPGKTIVVENRFTHSPAPRYSDRPVHTSRLVSLQLHADVEKAQGFQSCGHLVHDRRIAQFCALLARNLDARKILMASHPNLPEPNSTEIGFRLINPMKLFRCDSLSVRHP